MIGSAPPWYASVTISSVASTDSLSTPSSTSAAATIGADNRSPRLESESSVRGVSSRSSAVPLQSWSPSPNTFSRCAVSRFRFSPSRISVEMAISCCLRSASKIAATWSSSLASARFAASINLFVTPPIADTTTTIGPSRDASFTICATRPMHAASPTDVPPNFITRNGFFIFSRIRREAI